jgi:hypothetical protein
MRSGVEPVERGYSESLLPISVYIFPFPIFEKIGENKYLYEKYFHVIAI